MTLVFLCAVPWVVIKRLGLVFVLPNHSCTVGIDFFFVITVVVVNLCIY